MKGILGLVLICVSTLGIAQTEEGLVAHYFFDRNLADGRGNSGNVGMSVDEPTFGCGLMGQSLSFNGSTDEVRFDGPVRDVFNSTNDFTLSLYFNALDVGRTMYLISKLREGCEGENAFYIRYQPGSRTVNIFLRERDGREINMADQLDRDRCWHHLVLIRNSGRVRLYADGVFLQEQATIGEIDLRNSTDLVLGNSDCRGNTESSFNGFIDEMRVYNIALRESDIRELFFSPEQIATKDTVIFLGGSVPVELTSNCADSYFWNPQTGVSDPASPTPVITPLFAGDLFYEVNLSNRNSGCVATDSIRITVVDPNSLDCGEVFLPNSFTPNNDGLNDTYGISNPFAIQQLLSFEIFDRWGSRVFATRDPFLKWDGSFKNQDMNPGILQYKVRFICNGEEKSSFGTLMLMR